MGNEDTNEDLTLHFEFSNEADATKAAEFIQERLSKLQMVKEVEAFPEEPRFSGLEVAAAIVIGVTITRNSREFLEEVRKLIPTIRGLFGEVKAAFMTQGEEKVELADGAKKSA